MASTDKSRCDEIMDALIEGRPSKEQFDHIAGCDDCRKSLQAINACRSLPNAFVGHDFSASEKNIVENLRQSLKIKQQSVSHKGSSFDFFAALFSRHYLVAASLAAIFLVALGFFLIPAPPAREAFQVSYRIGNQPEVFAAAGETIDVKDSEKSFLTVNFSKNCLITALAPVRFKLGKDGIYLNHGKVRVSVKPGTGGFAVITSEALVEVVGTVFLVERSKSETRVVVESGIVKVSTSTEQKDIKAGGSLSIKARAEKDSGQLLMPNSGEIAEPPENSQD